MKWPEIRRLWSASGRGAGGVGSEPSQICTIYDIGEDQDRNYIVMEYLEGSTLKYRIEGKPISVEQLVDFRGRRSRMRWMWRTPPELFIAI